LSTTQCDGIGVCQFHLHDDLLRLLGTASLGSWLIFLVKAIPVPRHNFIIIVVISYGYVDFYHPLRFGCVGQNCRIMDEKCFVTTRMSVMKRGSTLQTKGETREREADKQVTQTRERASSPDLA